MFKFVTLFINDFVIKRLVICSRKFLRIFGTVAAWVNCPYCVYTNDESSGYNRNRWSHRKCHCRHFICYFGDHPINQLYRYRTGAIMIGLFFYFWACIILVIMVFPHSRLPYGWMMISTSVAWGIGRSAQYAVFTMRLHHTYGNTDYAYPKWLLWGITIWGILGLVSITIMWLLTVLPGVYEIDDQFGRKRLDSPGFDIYAEGDAAVQTPFGLFFS